MRGSFSAPLPAKMYWQPTSNRYDAHDLAFCAGSTYMRVSYRWLVVVIFVVAIIGVVVVRGSRRTVQSPVTITFLGYTNLPGTNVRSAVFSVRFESGKSMGISSPMVDGERLDFYTHGELPISNRPPTRQS